MRYKFCPECGNKLTEIEAGDDGMVPYCAACDKRWFDSFQSCVIVLTYNEYDEIVLSNQWYLSNNYTSFTSGFMKPGETAEECAVREVKEELGLDLESIEYAGTYWLEGPEQLMHGFIGFAKKKELVLSKEIDAARWVPVYEAAETMFPDKPGGPLYEVYHKFLKMLAGDRHMGKEESAPPRIYRMEAILQKATQTLNTLDANILELQQVQGDIQELADYYDSPEWRKDFEADEKGLFSSDLRRGVLSEDGIYNLLERNKETMEMLKPFFDEE